MAESRLNHGWITGQAYGKYIAGTISEEDRKDIVRKACPGPGACGGMYTANTMATATEAVQMAVQLRVLMLWVAGLYSMVLYIKKFGPVIKIT